MNLILTGAPGSGKGTQSKLLAKELEIPQISTGDILRDNLARETALGLEAKTYMEKGDLVPDSIIFKLIKDELLSDKCKNGFILDGFPRNEIQSKELHKILINIGKHLNKVIYIDVKDEEVIRRISSRRICENCKSDYNILFNKPKEDGICDKCGGSLITRLDDKEETIKNRLKVYKKTISPVINFYRRNNLVEIVDGNLGFTEVFENIKRILKEKK